VVCKKLNLTRQKHAFTNQKKCATTQKKTKARLGCPIQHPAWKSLGLFSKEKISEEKRISGETYDINKQTIYTASKSKIESGTHSALELAWGMWAQGTTY